MRHNLNKKNKRYVITAAATIFTLAIMTASIMATPAVATTMTTTTSPEAGIMQLSPEPVYQEQIRDIMQTPINQTHLQITTLEVRHLIYQMAQKLSEQLPAEAE